MFHIFNHGEEFSYLSIMDITSYTRDLKNPAVVR
jgi:hypothetical protein